VQRQYDERVAWLLQNCDPKRWRFGLRLSDGSGTICHSFAERYFHRRATPTNCTPPAQRPSMSHPNSFC